MHVRVASPSFARALIAAAVACAAAAGCGDGSATAHVAVTVAVAPVPPRAAAESIARVTLRDAEGRPVSGARVQVEAHMPHPGMTPVVADAAERGDGIYEARLQFTMAGDWILVATGQLADGSRIVPQDLPVSGVRPAR